MSDDPVDESGEEGPSPIPVEQVLAFYRAKLKQKACAECGTDNWEVEAYNPGDPYPHGTAFTIGFPDPDLAFYLAAVALTCLNCGHMKFISRSVISKWEGPING